MDLLVGWISDDDWALNLLEVAITSGGTEPTSVPEYRQTELNTINVSDAHPVLSNYSGKGTMSADLFEYGSTEWNTDDAI